MGVMAFFLGFLALKREINTNKCHFVVLKCGWFDKNS
jgi:hypothetical protein